MVEQITFQTVFQFLQTAGILVGIFYYLNILRANQQNQTQAEETRKIQLLMQIHNAQDMEYSERRSEVATMDISEYDDFVAEIDRITWSKVATTWAEWNQLGLLLKYGFVDQEMMFDFLHGRGPIIHWDKYGSFIKDIRVNRKWYSYCLGFEYLADEMRKYRDKQEQEYIKTLNR